VTITVPYLPEFTGLSRIETTGPHVPCQPLFPSRRKLRIFEALCPGTQLPRQDALLLPGLFNLQPWLAHGNKTSKVAPAPANSLRWSRPGAKEQSRELPRAPNLGLPIWSGKTDRKFSPESPRSCHSRYRKPSGEHNHRPAALETGESPAADPGPGIVLLR
jgi:hypothetical protein